LDGVYDREEDKEFLERIYVKNYFWLYNLEGY
jgi:hypothetical protein